MTAPLGKENTKVSEGNVYVSFSIEVYMNVGAYWSMNSVLTPNASAMYPSVRER